jgi:hypothetical protein
LRPIVAIVPRSESGTDGPGVRISAP